MRLVDEHISYMVGRKYNTLLRLVVTKIFSVIVIRFTDSLVSYPSMSQNNIIGHYLRSKPLRLWSQTRKISFSVLLVTE